MATDSVTCMDGSRFDDTHGDLSGWSLSRARVFFNEPDPEQLIDPDDLYQHADDYHPDDPYDPEAGATEADVADVLLLVAALPPGAEAVALLSSLTARSLSADQWLTVAQLWQPLINWVSGQESAAVAACAGPAPSPDAAADVKFVDPAALELAAALDCGQDFARDKVNTARVLAPGALLAATGELLRAGTISPYRAQLIAHALQSLPAEVAAAAEALILPKAPNGQPASLKHRIKRAILEVNAAEAAKAWLDSVAGRRVVFDDGNADGLIGMHAYFEPVVALAVQQHLNAAAGGRKDFDGRGKDARMADALAGCVLGTKPDDPSTPLAPKVRVQLTMSLPVLLGLRENLGELVGFGPVPAPIARLLAKDAEFQRFVFEPADGHLIDLGTKHYTPSPELHDLVTARDRRCRFPGSNRSAENADDDHIKPFGRGSNADKGGSTSYANLGKLGRHNHRAKTHGGFTATPEDNAVVRWQTPLGRVYRTRPHDYRDPEDRPPDPPPEP